MECMTEAGTLKRCTKLEAVCYTLKDAPPPPPPRRGGYYAGGGYQKKKKTVSVFDHPSVLVFK
jgi:hypothetical protein